MRLTRIACAATLIGLGSLSLACYASYCLDQARLRAVAARAAGAAASPADRAVRLTSWVHHHRGFGKNTGFFLVRRLGPTPIQVLEGGGDCSDKSRLLSSMLRTFGIPSTLAMCFDAPGRPTHTVVNAHLPDGTDMVLDPIWDLSFPREPAGGYYGLLDLRRDPAILWRRLDAVVATAGPADKIRRYNRYADIYDYASTFNWDKNALTRLVGSVLVGRLGDRAYGVDRPAFLEEPKLFVSLAGLLSALGVVAAWGTSRVLRRRDRAGRDGVGTATPPPTPAPPGRGGGPRPGPTDRAVRSRPA